MGCLDMAIPTEYRFDGTSGPSLITSVPGGPPVVGFERDGAMPCTVNFVTFLF